MRFSLLLLSAAALFCLPLAEGNARTGDIQKGRAIAETCAACHGIDGENEVEGFPILAGQKYKYLVKQLREMRAAAKIRAGSKVYLPKTASSLARARRSNEMMDPFVIELTDDDINDVSAYFANLKCRKLLAAPPLPAPRMAIRCQVCHGKEGVAKNSNIPNIAGQDATYMEQQMLNFRAAKLQADDGLERRRSAIMEGQAANLSDRDINELSLYYSRLPCSQ